MSKIKLNFLPHCSKKICLFWPPIVVVALVILAFGAGWAFGKFNAAKVEPTTVAEQSFETTEEIIEVEEETELLTPTVIDDLNVLTIEWFETDEQKIRETDYVWNNIVFGDQLLSPEDGAGPKAFALGIVKGGVYDSYELQHYIAGISGLGVTQENYYLLIAPDETKRVILDNYASAIGLTFSTPVSQVSASELLGENRLSVLAAHEQAQGDYDYRQIILDSGVKISELEIAETVKDTAGRTFKLVGVWRRSDYPDFSKVSFNEPEITVTLENDQTLNLYNGSDLEVSFASSLFYYVRPDNRTVWYITDLGIGLGENEDWGGPNLSAETTGVPKITWNDGKQNATTYFNGIQGGCGTVGGLNVVDIEIIGELKEVGTSAAGKIYGPVSFDTEYFRPTFESWKVMAPEGEVRETLEQFAASHPFFYFQDSFGRWIEFKNTEILPMAECGKPVIYLYPETTTDLEVQLYPQGGFTYTEPIYKDGWRVTASPDGTLVNRDDGEVYPYLFWEGRGGMYVPPSRYWVVNQSSVHDFLVSTLTRLGLNNKETADFMEFWEPRMQESSYYKIGFYGTEVMNRLAPLAISEKPDTLIRILMDYQPLEVAEKSNPPILPTTPERYGFTVIEWGGVLR